MAFHVFGDLHSKYISINRQLHLLCHNLNIPLLLIDGAFHVGQALFLGELEVATGLGLLAQALGGEG